MHSHHKKAGVSFLRTTCRCRILSPICCCWQEEHTGYHLSPAAQTVVSGWLVCKRHEMGCYGNYGVLISHRCMHAKVALFTSPVKWHKMCCLTTCLFACQSYWWVVQETGGIYNVGMSDKHVEECVMDHAPPPPTKASGSAASLVSHGIAEAGVGCMNPRLVTQPCLLQQQVLRKPLGM